ncbi:MAG: riboflavin synthase [Planctomycetota bacterium]
MFTGLIEGMGEVRSLRRVGEGLDLCVDLSALDGGVTVGESIALSGCCTTVTRLDGRTAWFHLTRESLARTWLGSLRVGDRLNLERCLTPTTRMGGHIVQGHVDGLAEVASSERRSDGTDLVLTLPAGLARYCVEKGSIALDGVSLTIARLDGQRVTIALIPHTMEVTTLGDHRPGRRLNCEVDVLAKYVERLLEGR